MNAADFPRLYEEMRQSGMNDWVGGDDPAWVGEIAAELVLRHLPPTANARVLDFGCGIGRVAVPMLRQRPDIQALTGFDIVPQMIEFCRRTIGAALPQTNFELVADRNAHYQQHETASAHVVARTQSELTAQYDSSYDAAYALSVFTHVDVDDFVPLLRFVRTLMKPGGHFVFTAFALTPFSRQQIAQGVTNPALASQHYEQDGDVLIGRPDDRLAFIGYDIRRIEAMIWEAGLIPCTVNYGEWRGVPSGHSYQDMIICRRPLAPRNGR